MMRSANPSSSLCGLPEFYQLLYSVISRRIGFSTSDLAILCTLTKPEATRRCHRSLANAKNPSDDGCLLSTFPVDFRELA